MEPEGFRRDLRQELPVSRHEDENEIELVEVHIRNDDVHPLPCASQCCCEVAAELPSSWLEKPSNETLLLVAFISFLGFTIAQSVAAFVAKSEAMMGDSAAMAVDALTYGFNLFAERKKREEREDLSSEEDDELEKQSPDRAARDGWESRRLRLVKQWKKRRQFLLLELIPPFMSVSILIVVTSFVLKKAIQTLVLDAHRSRREQSRPSLVLMMVFSVVNLLLDLVNVTCFARAKHLMGFSTVDTVSTKAKAKKECHGVRQYDILDDDNDNQNGHEHSPTCNGKEYEMSNKELGAIALGAPDSELSQTERYTSLMDQIEQSGRTTTPSECDSSEETEDLDEERVNLNMCSAYTHVFADTLRSLAVIMAAMTAELVEPVTPEEADATAAVIVSVIILASLLPLIRGLLSTLLELRQLFDEEKAFLESSAAGPKKEASELI